MLAKTFRLSVVCLVLLLCGQWTLAQTKHNVLVFSKTAAFRHQSIEAGKTALAKMAKEKGFAVSFTEDASQFTELNLRRFNAVVFLNTTGDVLNNEQQNVFERYIQAGGGYVGIHAATDTEYEWPWYGRLAGAYFLDHPITPSNVQKGKFIVKLKSHWATKGMPDEFERTDEFYSFKDISPNINVVLTIDEKSYIGGKNPDYHPMSWYQAFEGGRAFYTAMGHTDETFSEALFLNHLWAGIQYAAGGDTPKPLDFSKARPEENRFTKVVLEEKLDEPMELTLLDKDRVLFIQRKGEVRLYNGRTKQLKTIAKIPVSTKYLSKEGKESMGEDGLMGLNKDPNFAQNQWVYLYYSSTKGSYNQLSRFTMKGDELLLSSEKEMLQVATQREECCHTGGSIAWDKAGNLYLSTGDNTNPHGSNGFSPSDERPGREAWDAQKSSANTNDLRGKILRIKPQADGTYTIPDGNLFAKGTPQTRPEIYTMGHRNPFRISVDKRTGYVYWGEVGPDASKPDDNRGPAGHDEVGQARKAGNFGWPHFVGDNKAYHKFDFVANQSGEKWNINAPTNTSPNNTGLKVLPAAQKAFIWYPYGESKEFPMVGSGGRNAMAGPVFYADDFKTAQRAFPKYYDGKFFAYEWMRGWIMAVTMDQEGNYVSMERFMPSYKFSNPMDMEFAENGDLYLLEYGSGWFTANDDARLVRIEYNGGNRKPQIQMAANQMGGAVPFNLKLTSQGTFDADGDPLTYTWKITSREGFNRVINTPDASLSLGKIGTYKVNLTVSDGKGGTNTQAMEVTAGNAPPVLSLEMPKSNKTFYAANQSFEYEIKVKDQEDGSLEGGIAPEQVAVNIDYLPEGYDKVAIAQGHRSADANALFATGKKLIDGSDCAACHKKDSKSIGPSYRDVALKYKGDKAAMERLTKKIIAGGSGVWGEIAMAGHPQLSTTDASEMVKYILNVANEKPKEKSLPVKGIYTAKVPSSDKGKGVYIVRAAYEDQGANGLPSLKSEQSFVLRNVKIDAHGFDEYAEVNKMSYGGNNLAIPKHGSFMKLSQIDLNGLSELVVMATAPKPQLNAIGGKAELRLDNPKGRLLGESALLEASDKMDFTPKPLTVPIEQVIADGKLHDVYLVFANPKAEVGSLMVVMGAEFKLTSAVVTPAAEAVVPTTTDSYAGAWEATVYGTPQGDAAMLINLERKDGKLVGSIKPKMTDAPAVTLDKIEESPERIVVYFKMSNFDLNLNLEVENTDTLKGTMMGMFKAKAVRVK
jgi:cytochrome c